MKKTGELINREFLCECGRKHYVPIRAIRSWDDSIPPEAFADIFGSAGVKGVLMICSSDTKACANDRTAETLKNGGFKLKVREFHNDRLINDEAAVGAAVLDADSGVDGIVAVGGGTVTDLGRFVASRLHKPFILVMTCPSMDGYASNIAAVSLDGKRKIFKDCEYPDAIFCETRVMRGAPADLIRSGFGDMLGKRTSLPDWVLSAHVTGEPFCGMTAAVMDDCSARCVRSIEGIVSREAEAVNVLTDALLLGGVSMALTKDTRPVSGSEHIFSHFIVESAMDAGVRISHGSSVGFGTLVSTLLYEYLLGDTGPAGLSPVEDRLRAYLLPSGRIKDLLTGSGISARAGDYLRETDIAGMIRRCAGPEKRYTILRYLADSGHLDDAIRYVTDAFGKMGSAA